MFKKLSHAEAVIISMDVTYHGLQYKLLVIRENLRDGVIFSGGETVFVRLPPIRY